MQQIRKLLKLDKMDYYETHLNIMNCILPIKMTPTEIKVLACFMSLEGDVTHYRFGPTAKKVVMNTVNPNKPLSPAGLSNYIGSLTKKGFLIETGDMTNILPLLVPESKEQLYTIKLVIQNGQ